jgi:hypothetical protein
LRPRLAALQTLVYADWWALATHGREMDDRTGNAVETGIWTHISNFGRCFFSGLADESSVLPGAFQEEQGLSPPSGSVLVLGQK